MLTCAMVSAGRWERLVTPKPIKAVRLGQCGRRSLMVAYHDSEWGVPVHDDRRHFEFLVLEGAQAGLSWAIVLRKREGYRRAFAEFDPAKVARFTREEHRGAHCGSRDRPQPAEDRSGHPQRAGVPGGAGRVRQLRRVLVALRGRPSAGQPAESVSEVPATSPESDAFSKDLKKRGFTFVGSTIIYAHMQAVGMVNDHLVDCFRFREVQRG